MELDAWLLNFGNGIRGVVGRRELLHLIPDAQTISIPRAASHCCRVLHWEGNLVPIWDVTKWVTEDAEGDAGSLVVIVGYQTTAGALPQLGALTLTEPPVRIRATNDQICTPPAVKPRWREVTSAMFMQNKELFGVLDLRHMFSGVLTT